MIKHTIPMGWNTWNTFGPNIDEEVVLGSAETLVKSGLKAAGYEYVVIDDCWALRERDSRGNLVPDPVKFPHGMRAVADAVHKLGLKFGMYSCSGLMTCAEYPGSYGHEYDDARAFARWGVDFLKYDYCFRPSGTDGPALYRRMGLALAGCGRDILFSACSWGADETHKWISSTGAHMWRSTPDILDNWESVKDLIKRQYDILPYGGVGCFNDMDMLVVGMHGKGNVGLAGCTDEEYRLHFAAWCLLGSPLMIGCDIRSMDKESFSTLTNRELISIARDPRGNRPYLFRFCGRDDLPIFVRALEGGEVAIGFFNLGDAPARMWISSEDVGVPSVRKLGGREVYSGEEAHFSNGVLVREVAAHACSVFRMRTAK